MPQLITNKGKEIILDRAFLETPTLTSPSQFKVGTGTTDPTLGDTDLETPVIIDIDQFKNFLTGFPLLDRNSLQSTIRGFLSLIEANGNDLTEFGTFNTDVTPLLFSRNTHTLISKTNKIEISYIEKDRIL